MGQRAITVYTPASADPHITAADDAFIYQSYYGVKSGIIGNMTCTKIDNNTVRLSGGCGVMNRGHILRIPDNENLDLTVETGASGYKRYDCVVAEFVRGGGDDADSYTIKIIKGTATTGTPTPPAMTHSGLAAKGQINQIELFRIYIDGTNLSAITQAVATLPTIPVITYGTANPSAGNNGDIYFKITN